MITSQARVHRVEQPPAQRRGRRPSVPGGGVWLQVRRTAAPKCVRCWHHRDDVGARRRSIPNCAAAVSATSAGPGEVRRFA